MRVPFERTRRLELLRLRETPAWSIEILDSTVGGLMQRDRKGGAESSVGLLKMWVPGSLLGQAPGPEVSYLL